MVVFTLQCATIAVASVFVRYEQRDIVLFALNVINVWFFGTYLLDRKGTKRLRRIAKIMLIASLICGLYFCPVWRG